MPGFFQFVNPAREEGLPGTGRSNEQQGIAAGEGDMFHAINQPIKGCVTRLNAPFQIRSAFHLLLAEARGNPIIPGKVEVYDRDRSRLTSIAGRRTLKQPAGQMPRLRQKEKADLSDVRPRRDVNEIVLGLRVERIAPCKAGK